MLLINLLQNTGAGLKMATYSHNLVQVSITNICPCNIQRFLKIVKNENLAHTSPVESFDIFLIFAQNINYGYTLEQPMF